MLLTVRNMDESDTHSAPDGRKHALKLLVTVTPTLVVDEVNPTRGATFGCYPFSSLVYFCFAPLNKMFVIGPLVNHVTTVG